MRKIIVVSLFIFIAFSCQSNKKEKTIPIENSTLYYFIRHAEKDRTDKTNNDPELTDIGIQRAKNWAVYFEDIVLDQVFSTNYKRTKQTASYTADKQGIIMLPYHPEKLYDDDFKKKTKNKTVLVVGHSDTTPEFVNAILGKQEYPQIEDSNNGNLYIVSLINSEVSVELKHID